MNRQKCKGAALRSKADMLDFDEKSSKYFFAREKARGIAATITQVRVDDDEPDSVIEYNEEYRLLVEEQFVLYWENIFAVRATDPGAQQEIYDLINRLIDDPTIPIGLPPQANTLGAPFTRRCCLEPVSQ